MVSQPEAGMILLCLAREHLCDDCVFISGYCPLCAHCHMSLFDAGGIIIVKNKNNNNNSGYCYMLTCMVWCWHPVPKEQESDMELSTLFPETDPQVPQTTVSSLCSRSGSSFGLYFCLRNTFAKNRHICWSGFFSWDIKRANGNNATVILVTWSTSFYFLNKWGISSLTALPAPFPHPSSRVQGRLSAWQTQPSQKQMTKENTLTKKRWLSLKKCSFLLFISG